MFWTPKISENFYFGTYILREEFKTLTPNQGVNFDIEPDEKGLTATHANPQ